MRIVKFAFVTLLWITVYLLGIVLDLGKAEFGLICFMYGIIFGYALYRFCIWTDYQPRRPRDDEWIDHLIENKKPRPHEATGASHPTRVREETAQGGSREGS